MTSILGILSSPSRQTNKKRYRTFVFLLSYQTERGMFYSCCVYVSSTLISQCPPLLLRRTSTNLSHFFVAIEPSEHRFREFFFQNETHGFRNRRNESRKSNASRKNAPPMYVRDGKKSRERKDYFAKKRAYQHHIIIVIIIVIIVIVAPSSLSSALFRFSDTVQVVKNQPSRALFRFSDTPTKLSTLAIRNIHLSGADTLSVSLDFRCILYIYV